jgi:hypothetical protein
MAGPQSVGELARGKMKSSQSTPLSICPVYRAMERISRVIDKGIGKKSIVNTKRSLR